MNVQVGVKGTQYITYKVKIETNQQNSTQKM